MIRGSYLNGFGERLDEAIIRSGLEPGQLSKISGVARGTIWKYRCYGVMPSTSNLARLCVALKVSADYLLGIDK